VNSDGGKFEILRFVLFVVLVMSVELLTFALCCENFQTFFLDVFFFFSKTEPQSAQALAFTQKYKKLEKVGEGM
jgi:hypothetical protein